MPYIDKKSREKYDKDLARLRKLINEQSSKGDLTYILYSLALEYFKGRESYTKISESIGSLSDAGEEIRRRKLNPYEDKKIKENGDVF